jgi:hypothetical protein
MFQNIQINRNSKDRLLFVQREKRKIYGQTKTKQAWLSSEMNHFYFQPSKSKRKFSSFFNMLLLTQNLFSKLFYICY